MDIQDCGGASLLAGGTQTQKGLRIWRSANPRTGRIRTIENPGAGNPWSSLGLGETTPLKQEPAWVEPRISFREPARARATSRRCACCRAPATLGAMRRACVMTVRTAACLSVCLCVVGLPLRSRKHRRVRTCHAINLPIAHGALSLSLSTPCHMF